MVEEIPPPEPDAPAGVVDPHGLAPAVARLSSGSIREGRAALAILGVSLDPDEQVEAIVQGLYQNLIGVCALTSKRVILVNEHEWVPDLRSIALTPELRVQGWQDDRTASLIFIAGGQSITISLIADRPLAQDMAHRIRAKVGEGA